jgi:hypothetical protein
MNISKQNPNLRLATVIIVSVCLTVIVVVAFVPMLQTSLSFQRYWFAYLAAVLLIAYNLFARD